MHTTYLEGKVLPPALPSKILHRAQLLQELNNVIVGPFPENVATCKLVLLCTPAGYGKTTLLADFARQNTLPCCWYFLEHSDSNPALFLEGILTSVRQKFPHFGSTLDQHIVQAATIEPGQEASHLNLEAIIDEFVEALQVDIQERFVLFFCNYHEIDNAPLINALVSRLLLNLPQQCVIVIESRTIPALELTRLLSRRQLVGLGSNHLRFSAQEISDLAQLLQQQPFSEQEALQIYLAFEGWIAGILLGTRLGGLQFLSPPLSNEQPSDTQFSHLQRQYLSQYLVDEVFEAEHDVYSFLKETSFLEQITSEICQVLLNIDDAEDRLAYIERQGLFLTHHNTETHRYYTCNPVIREILYHQLYQEDAENVAALHRRAADWKYGKKDYEQAIVHALAAREEALAIQFIVERSKPLLSQGQTEALERWLTLLPASTVDQSPKLLLLQAKILLMKRGIAQIQPLLEKAQVLLIQPATPAEQENASITFAEILICQSMAQFQLGNYALSHELCQQALALLPADERELRAQAHQQFGRCASLLGNCRTGIVHMQQALQLWGHNTEILETALLHGNLANAYHIIGNHALAEYHRARAIASCHRLGAEYGEMNNLVGMANTKRHKGLLEEAEEMLNQVLTMARNAQFHSCEAYALENLGEIYQDQDRFMHALPFFEDALALARQLEDTYLINIALCELAVTYLLMRDPQTALLHIDQVSGIDHSYIGAQRELTRGSILIFQHQYAEAASRLTAIVEPANQAEFKRLYLRILIRLAICQVALEQTNKAIGTLQQAVQVMEQGDYDYVVQIELRRAPTLFPLAQKISQLASFIPFQAEATQPEGGEQDEDVSGSRKVITSLQRTLSVLAFGEPSMMINHLPITRWRLARSLELCFFLFNHGGVARKEQIIDALWSDNENVDQGLRSTVYYLRKTLGENSVTSQSGIYRLNLAPLYGDEVFYDVSVFRQHYAKARKALKQAYHHQAQALLQQMLKLYRGDYVQSFYSDWCIGPRDELRRMYMYALQQLAQLAWNNELLEESIAHWQRLLAIDNCYEQAHHGLMLCYIRQGKRSLALRQYQRCVDTLQAELSISPGLAIQKLHQRFFSKD